MARDNNICATNNNVILFPILSIMNPSSGHDIDNIYIGIDIKSADYTVVLLYNLLISLGPILKKGLYTLNNNTVAATKYQYPLLINRS